MCLQDIFKLNIKGGSNDHYVKNDHDIASTVNKCFMYGTKTMRSTNQIKSKCPGALQKQQVGVKCDISSWK